jgi:hypothetical protein
VGSGGLGTTVVPYLMGVIGERATIRAAMISPALLFLVITLIFWRFGRANAGVAALGGQPGTKASQPGYTSRGSMRQYRHPEQS